MLTTPDENVSFFFLRSWLTLHHESCMPAEGMLNLELKRECMQTTADLSLLCYSFSKGRLILSGCVSTRCLSWWVKKKRKDKWDVAAV